MIGMQQIEDLSREAIERLADLRTADAMQLATRGMNTIRASQDRPSWRSLATSEELEGLRRQLQEDPYTRRGFAKPRGYAGDAVLVDYIYGLAPLPEDTTELGRSIFAWCSEHSDAFRAVRSRCERMAQLIDQHAARKDGVRVLSVACGHLREAQQSKATVGGHIEELVALDHDPESLRIVDASCRGLPVRTVQASVTDLLKGNVDESGFDLIYATGLFDYLGRPVATLLVRDLAQRLRTGGRLVVGNFLQMWEAAYIEAFMDWWLVYRTKEDLRSLAADLDDSFTVGVVTDPWEVIAYLEVHARDDCSLVRDPPLCS